MTEEQQQISRIGQIGFWKTGPRSWRYSTHLVLVNVQIFLAPQIMPARVQGQSEGPDGHHVWVPRRGPSGRRRWTAHRGGDPAGCAAWSAFIGTHGNVVPVLLLFASPLECVSVSVPVHYPLDDTDSRAQAEVIWIRWKNRLTREQLFQLDRTQQ